jgi:prepilin-type N-terminal cleavage/methylation domain-containing protein/prepilin-type processing-associated H-X9-DG protein
MKRRNAFTLIELLVVIAIIALLLSIITPALRKAKEQARLVICGSNQRQIVQAVAVYQADNEQSLPPAIAGLQKTPYRGQVTTNPDDVSHWHRPTVMSYAVGNPAALNGGHHGRYMLPYLDSVDVYNCPSAPIDAEMEVIAGSSTYTYQKGYQEILPIPDCTYTLLWNYQGFDTTTSPTRFVGPGSKKKEAAGLLLTDTVFYSNNYGQYGYPGDNMLAMTHPFDGASKQAPNYPQRIYYLLNAPKPTGTEDFPKVQLNAGYVDGHVERFDSRQTVNCKNAVVDLYLPQKFK